MTSPTPRMPLVVAHRGASHEEPEHTLAAYRLALAHGADGLECDVRLTADDELVCIHDRSVHRTSDGGKGIVSTLTLAQLESLDFGSWHRVLHGREVESERHPERFGVLRLRPLLDLVMAAETPPVTLIETKHPLRRGWRLERLLVDTLREYGLASGDRPGMPRVRVMSFSHMALWKTRELAPDIPLVQLRERAWPLPTWRGWLPHGVRRIGIDIEMVRARPEHVRWHHERGHEVAVWTVDEPADVRLCAGLGVDVIITNKPAEVRAVLATL